MKNIFKRLAKWAIKTLKREGKKTLRDKLNEPLQDIGIPRKKRRK